MKRHKNFNLLLMLVLLVAVGQMAQTIYIPAIADMAVALNVREGAVQSVMAAYLLTYGISQLFYGPLSDRVGRRPVILVGMSIFMLATLVAITTHSLPVLIAASAMQGMGTGVGGVMARTLPRDLYEGAQLRHANSLLNMGILVSPLIAPAARRHPRHPVELARLLRFPAGPVRRGDLQHGEVDAGNAPGRGAAHQTSGQLQNAVRHRRL